MITGVSVRDGISESKPIDHADHVAARSNLPKNHHPHFYHSRRAAMPAPYPYGYPYAPYYGYGTADTAANMGQAQKVGNVVGSMVGMGAQFQTQKGAGRRSFGYPAYGYPYYGYGYDTAAGMGQSQNAGQISGSKLSMGSQGQNQMG